MSFIVFLIHVIIAKGHAYQYKSFDIGHCTYGNLIRSVCGVAFSESRNPIWMIGGNLFAHVLERPHDKQLIIFGCGVANAWEVQMLAEALEKRTAQTSIYPRGWLTYEKLRSLASKDMVVHAPVGDVGFLASLLYADCPSAYDECKKQVVYADESYETISIAIDTQAMREWEYADANLDRWVCDIRQRMHSITTFDVSCWIYAIACGVRSVCVPINWNAADVISIVPDMPTAMNEPRDDQFESARCQMKCAARNLVRRMHQLASAYAGRKFTPDL